MWDFVAADEMKSLGDDSLPIDVTRDEKAHEAHVAHMAQQAGHIAPSAVEEDRLSPSHLDSSFAKAAPDNVEIKRTPVHAGYVISTSNHLVFLEQRSVIIGSRVLPEVYALCVEERSYEEVECSDGVYV